MKHSIGPITRQAGLAGQVGYHTNVTYEDGSVTSVFFAGTLYGSPGPVYMLLDNGTQTRVDEPVRFGTRFNKLWVEKFFETAKDEK